MSDQPDGPARRHPRPPPSSAYGNPQPYKTPELERHAIEGRIKVARAIATTTDRPDTAARWGLILDELLDRLAEVDARATTAAMEAG